MKFAKTAAEEAQKINDQTDAGYVTDQSFWERQGIFTGEDLAVSVVNQTYSDLHKSMHGFRPRHKSFTSVEEAQMAIDKLDDYYESMIEQEELSVQQQAAYEAEREELESLMPGDFDFEQYPQRSGMRRRMENKTSKNTSLLEAFGFKKKIAKKLGVKELRTIILQEMQMHPFKAVDSMAKSAATGMAREQGLIEQEEKQAEDKKDVEVTGDPAKDLETAYGGGPEGVRAFMDAQGNKDPEVQDILVKAAEEEDGADPDDKISVSSASPVDVSSLGPTQQFIDLMQSVSFPLGSAEDLNKSVTTKTSGAPGAISVSGDAVLDGHHRWSGVYAISPDGKISAKDFGFPGDVADKLAAAQLAVAAVNDSGKHPSKGGGAATDIIGKSKDAIVAMIDANKGKQTDANAPGPLLNDKMMKDIADGKFPAVNDWAGLSGEEDFVSLSDSAAGFENDPIRKAIADKVGENLSSLPQPLDGAPKSREDMPQLDHESIGGKSGLQQIEKGLPTGEFNVVPPFAKESKGKTEDVIIERWQKLAGILKG